MAHTPLHVLLVVALLAASVPTALGMDQEEEEYWYEFEDEIPVFVSAYAIHEGHTYTFDVSEGTTITATLTWEDPDVDMEVTIRDPAKQCMILPNPDVFCVVDNVAPDPACAGDSEPRDLSETERSVERTVEDAGERRIHATALFAEPMSTVPYTLNVTLDKEPETVSTGTAPLAVSLMPHCHLVE